MTKLYKFSILYSILLPLVSANYVYAQYQFYEIEYYHNPIYTGSTGPFHHYKIRLESDGGGKIIYSVKNDSGPSRAFIHEFGIPDDTKADINRKMNANDIIGTENQFGEDPEFGSVNETEFAKISYSKVISDSMPHPVVLKTMSTPIFPKEAIKEKLKAFYIRINSAVPEDIWGKIKSWTEQK